MRSHAKASSAGSTLRQGSYLGRIVCGALAAPAASSDADGSSAPSRRRLAGLTLLLTALALLAFAPSAFASKGVVGFIGSSSEGSSEKQFSGPAGVAVNQAGNDGTGNSGAAAGDVYIVDKFNNRIQQFSASGTFKRTFGFEVGGAGVNVCTSSCTFGSSSSEAGGMSSPQGIAVDQANGLVYVTDRFNRRVDVFAANGAFQGAFGWGALDGSAEFQFCTTTCHEPNFSGSSEGQGGKFGAEIGYPAVAPSGDVFVADKWNDRVDEFTPTINGSGEVTAVTFTRAWGWNVAKAGDPGDTAANEFEVCTTACQAGSSNVGVGGFGGAGPASLAIDSAGNSYVIDTSNKRVEKFGPGGASPAVFAAAQLSGEPAPVDIAVDRTNNHVFAIKPCNSTTCPPGSFPPPFFPSERRVLEFDSSGTLVDTHAAGAGIQQANGLAENQSSGKLYMTTSNAGIFGALVLSSPPVLPVATVDPGSGFAHTANTATFTGTVDPTGLAASCHFEYSTDGSDWIDADGAQGSGTLTAGSRTITEVSTTLGAFKSGQLLESSDGGLLGEDSILAVDPVAHTLTVSFAPTTSGSATLTANSRTSLCGGLDPNGGPQAVSQEAKGLSGSQLYHVRLFAAKAFAGGAATSDETTFTTDPSPPVIFRIAPAWAAITTTSAEIEAEVNPENQATSYHVEYVTQQQFETSGWTGAQAAPAGPGDIGSANHTVLLSTLLSGLTPGVEYRARGVAVNPSGTVPSPAVSFSTYPDYGSLGSCPQNEQFRTGPSAALPDCRAYEQASPVDKNGGDVIGESMHTEASLDGDAVTLLNLAGLPGGVGSEQFPTFVARRSADGWSTAGLLAPSTFGFRAFLWGWTPDLAYSFTLSTEDNSDTNGGPEHVGYVMRSPDGHFKLIAPYTDGAEYFYAGSSADDSKIFFETSGEGLPVSSGTAPAADRDNLYVYDRETEQLTLVGVLPASEGGEAPSAGSFAGPYDWFSGGTNLESGGARLGYFTRDDGAVSASGDKAFFTASETGEIYMRENSTKAQSPVDGSGECTDPTLACTVDISANQGGSGEAKPKLFQRATPSGSEALFTSCQKLTADSTAVSTPAFRCDQESQGADLYRYNTSSGDLTDLTVDNTDPEGAQVQAVIGASESGDFVYFVANGVLASNEGAGGTHAALGDCGGYESGTFLNGHGSCNLYLWHEGAITFIAPLDAENPHDNLDSGDLSDWEGLVPDLGSEALQPNARVSSDGHTLVFSSINDLTASETSGTHQFYRYRYGDQRVTCISCNPSGHTVDSANLIDIHPPTVSFELPPFLTRNLSPDGDRFFFETAAKLVPADTNGLQDAYEWEAAGSGSCHTSPGCYYLISSGSGAQESFLGDVSASGNDVFFFTHDRLVPQDQDELQDVYDARVGGGLASQHHVSPPPCEAEGCRGPASSPAQVTGAGTASFAGPGNPAPSHPKAKKHHRKRRHGKHRKRHRAHRRTAANRGGQK